MEDRGHGDIFHLLHNNLACVQIARVYRLHVPAAFVASNDKPLPMVVDFHGWGGDSNSQADLKAMFVNVSKVTPLHCFL